MEITGEYRLGASRERVWELLNDTTVLQQCIPGCESLEETAENTFDAKIVAAVGPVRAKFKTQIRLENLNPPNSYSIVGEAKSGAAGFGRGEAQITLTQDGDGTLLAYEADLKVGGKLAQIGSRLVAGATRKTADDFFGRFSELVDPQSQVVVEEADADTPTANSNKVWWAVAAAVVALALLYVLF
jgi:carbon monoxide dehydrogenase subunit G